MDYCSGLLLVLVQYIDPILTALAKEQQQFSTKSTDASETGNYGVWTAHFGLSGFIFLCHSLLYYPTARVVMEKWNQKHLIT